MMIKRRVSLAIVFVFFTAPLAWASPSHCVFHASQNHFEGNCGALFDQIVVITLAPAKQITTGIWRTDRSPQSVWAGETIASKNGNEPLELELYADGHGILRTAYGWFAVTGFAANPAPLFDVEASREIAPNALDIAIVHKAAEILSSDATWNRADNRKCPDNAKSWSLYCALEKAAVEVTGAFDHRRPALEAVRILVDERTANRGYHHRLMEYNNDPTTTRDEIQTLLTNAAAGMSAPEWLAAHGFAPPDEH